MPENPEVKIIARQLNHILKDNIIVDITNEHDKSIIPNDINNKHIVIESVNNKGKLIYFITNTNYVIINHLMLSGTWHKAEHLYSRYVIIYKNNDKINKLYLTDPRKFATFNFIKSTNLDDTLNKLAPSILDDGQSEADFTERIHKYKNSTQHLYTLLMDQKKITTGVGNYIACEALYRAKLSPYRKLSSLSDIDIHNLYMAIRHIMFDSYAEHGNSLKDYVDINDLEGSYQKKLEVYGQKHKKGIKHDKIGGRTMWWMPDVQK